MFELQTLDSCAYMCTCVFADIGMKNVRTNFVNYIIKNKITRTNLIYKIDNSIESHFCMYV